jgi:tetratricopeptide (TPR) repeat protein
MAGNDLVDRLQGFLGEDPDNWSLRAETFDAALAAGQKETARAQVAYALGAHPDDAAWRHREAVLMLSESQYAEAQAAFEALIASGHGDPVIQYNRAYALFAQGQLEAARDVLAPLLSLPDESTDIAWVLWLRCQHRLSHLDDALAAFVGRTFERPHSADAFGVASLIAIDAARMDDARTWSERALRGRPDQLEALVARGTIALSEQDAQGAVEWFQRALQVNPGDGRSWSGLAFARMLQKSFPAALEAFEKAVSAMPDHIATWNGFGWCQFVSKQPEAALECFERSLRLDRNFGETHGSIAVALARLGRTEQAKNEIEVALRLDPKCLSARYAQAILSGEADDPRAFLRLSRRVLSQRPARVGSKSDETLADVVFRGAKE